MTVCQITLASLASKKGTIIIIVDYSRWYVNANIVDTYRDIGLY